MASFISHNQWRTIMTQRFSLLFLITLIVFPLVQAQHFYLDINVDVTASRFNPNVDPERTINTNFRDDDPFNPLRAKLFPTIKFNETFTIEGDFLFDNKGKRFDRTKGNQPFRMDGLFLAVKGLLRNNLNLWFGKIPTPVGTFSPRSYSHVNPLIGWPLAYHYKIPYNVFTASSEASNLALRDNNYGAGTSIYEACWITGITALGNVNNMEYMIAIGRGTLTNPEASANKGFQIAGRLGYKFSDNIKTGLSAGIAPYLEYSTGLPTGTSLRDPKHIITGIDVAIHVSNIHLSAEGFYNSWDTPQYQNEKSIHAYTWYVEGQYFLFPDLYTALRFDRILYHDITDPITGQKTPWGYNVSRIEAGFGYKLLEQLTIKAIVQQNFLSNPNSNSITILGLQAAFRFEDFQTLVGWDAKGQPSY